MTDIHEIPPYIYRHFNEYQEVSLGKSDVLMIESCLEYNGMTESELAAIFKHTPKPHHPGITWAYSFRDTCVGHHLLEKRGDGRWHPTSLGIDQLCRVEIRCIRGRWYGWEDDDLRSYRLEHPVTKRHYWDQAVDYCRTQSVQSKIRRPCAYSSNSYSPIEYLHIVLIEAASSGSISLSHGLNLIRPQVSETIPPEIIIQQCVTDKTLTWDNDTLMATSEGTRFALDARKEAIRRANILRAQSLTRQITDEFVLRWGSDYWWDDSVVSPNGKVIYVNNRARNRLTRLWHRWSTERITPDHINHPMSPSGGIA